MVPSGVSVLTMSKLQCPSHVNHESILGSQPEGCEQGQCIPARTITKDKTLLLLKSWHGGPEKREALGVCAQTFTVKSQASLC